MNRDKLVEVVARVLSEDGFAADWPHGIRSAQAALEAIEQAGFRIVPEDQGESGEAAFWTF